MTSANDVHARRIAGLRLALGVSGPGRDPRLGERGDTPC